MVTPEMMMEEVAALFVGLSTLHLELVAPSLEVMMFTPDREFDLDGLFAFKRVSNKPQVHVKPTLIVEGLLYSLALDVQRPPFNLSNWGTAQNRISSLATSASEGKGWCDLELSTLSAGSFDANGLNTLIKRVLAEQEDVAWNDSEWTRSAHDDGD